MAWTQADVDALDSAIKSGTRQVRFADREVTYMSMDDLLKARAFASDQVAAAQLPPGGAGTSGGVGTRQFRFYSDKGW